MSPWQKQLRPARASLGSYERSEARHRQPLTLCRTPRPSAGGTTGRAAIFHEGLDSGLSTNKLHFVTSPQMIPLWKGVPCSW